jgi:hypothetical protein
VADLSSILGSAGIGGQIGQAIVRLELDQSKYQAELRAAQAQTTAGANQMGSALKTFGGIAKAGLGVAALGVVGFGAVSIKAASGLGEAVNKSNVIFGENAREIETWAEGGAKAFGLSKTAALDAAGGFGAMLQTAGLAVSESANMSKSLVQLAGDMASFNNIDPTEALEKLRSGLAGEAEPLRRYGVFLSEAAVQQEAYTSGIAKTGEELTEAQKVQARYNIIFAQTTKQQGDFQRTAESLPNQLRSMRAEFTNIAAEVGQKLLPVATDLLGVIRGMVPALSALGDVLPTITRNLDVLVGVLAAFYTGSKLAAAGVVGLGSALGPIALLIAGAVSAGRAINDVFYAADQSVDEFAATLSGELKPALDAGIISAQQYAEVQRALADPSFEGFSAARDAIEEVTRAIDRQRERQEAELLGREASMHQWEQYRDVLQSGARDAREVAGATGRVGDEVEDTRRKIEKFAGMTGKALDEWRVGMEESFRTAIFALEDLTTESAITEDDVVTAFRNMRGEARDFSRAMNALKDERWINEEFKVFLSEQGPEWLIGFANSNEREQRRMQTQWEESQRVFDRSLKGSFLDLNGALDKLDRKTTNHTVRVKYVYEGFDPSKPGMGVSRASA